MIDFGDEMAPMMRAYQLLFHAGKGDRKEKTKNARFIHTCRNQFWAGGRAELGIST